MRSTERAGGDFRGITNTNYSCGLQRLPSQSRQRVVPVELPPANVAMILSDGTSNAKIETRKFATRVGAMARISKRACRLRRLHEVMNWTAAIGRCSVCTRQKILTSGFGRDPPRSTAELHCRTLRMVSAGKLRTLARLKLAALCRSMDRGLAKSYCRHDEIVERIVATSRDENSRNPIVARCQSFESHDARIKPSAE